MLQYGTIIIIICIAYIIPQLTLSARVEPIYNETQYIIVYITTKSSISPDTFEDSFTTFSVSLQSVIYETLPTLSNSFNITQINLWCLPNNSNIYSSFYMKITYNSDKNDIILPIIDRMNNDLLSQILINKIKTIDSQSVLINPNPFTFHTYDITSTKNDSFLLNSQMDCITYLSQIQNKHSQTPTPTFTNMDTYINHDDDDYVQFFVYGMTQHWQVFLIWSIICITLGITICTAIFCWHINFVEKQRIKNKKKRRKQRKEQTPSVVTSTTQLSDDIITIIRPNSETDHSHHRNQSRSVHIKRRSRHNACAHSVTIDSQTDLIQQRKTNYNKHRKRNKSHSNSSFAKTKSKSLRTSKYDKIPTHIMDEEDVELKQDELMHISDDMNDIITRRMPIDKLEFDEDEDVHSFRRNSSDTQRTNNTNIDNKVVTVHVHHHYNPNISAENISIHSPVDNNIKPTYPDLPHYIGMNSPIPMSLQAQHSPICIQKSVRNIESLFTIPDNDGRTEQKEPSKSQTQREGFSPFTKPMSRKGSAKQLNGVRKSIASQPADDLSDSELMYAPGPAADDTPGQNQTPHTRTPRDCTY